MRATANIYLNKNKPSENGKCPISIKITYDRERKYFPTGVKFTQDEFESQRGRSVREDMEFVKTLLAKAQGIVNSLGDTFTFPAFEKKFLQNKVLKGTLEEAFLNYIDSMAVDQVGNKEVYHRAMVSFTKFHKNAKFADVTERWLNRYEKQMLMDGKSITTVGMYTICLRTIFNKEGITGDLYPFGRDKYVIPTAKNKKRALTIDEVGRVLYHEISDKESVKMMCRDLWAFIYFGNGLNVSDLCRIKNSDLNSNIGEIQFIRKKTKATKRDEVKISFQLNEITRPILEKYRNESQEKEDYLFPFLNGTIDEESRIREIKNLTWLINKHVKKVAEEVAIDKRVTTYYARHSFATIMKNSGANIAMISQMLGHSSIKTTELYFDGFANEEMKKAVKVLMPGKE